MRVVVSIRICIWHGIDSHVGLWGRDPMIGVLASIRPNT